MTLYIKIDSLNDIPRGKMNNLLSEICETIMGFVITDDISSGDIYFNYSIKMLKNGYKKIKEGDKLIGIKCGICLDEYKENEYKREIKCKHVYHKRCVDKWLKQEYSCPLCRSNDI